MTNRVRDLERIRRALEAADQVLRQFESGRIAAAHKANHDPVTEADLACDRVLQEVLLEPDEGWLSEETADEPDRLSKDRVWVVDPLDGTKEFVAGIPEWCVSVGLVEDGIAVAGGILNPAAGFIALGAEGLGCTLNGVPAGRRASIGLNGATVLASRTEFGRGQWEPWEEAPFAVLPMGSVAYKMARVACGLADATWTLVPKHEWDVAGGTALVSAGGGMVCLPDGGSVRFNQPSAKLPGLIAVGPGLLPSFDLTQVVYGGRHSA
ncbi:MAG: 3'(2'),5'-bisphosphate nucleotidase CysQ [Acidimicrobiia bacterium]